MKKIYTLVLSASAVLMLNTSAKAQSFFEDFEDITTLVGWDSANVSAPIGTTGWFQGNTTVFTAQSNQGYVGANFNNCSGTGTISNWLVAPQRYMHDGDMIVFNTRKVDSGATNYPDRLQLRLSVSPSSQLPADQTGVGTFTTLLLDINPNYSNSSGGNGYPYDWKRYAVTITGLPGGQATCKFAFRYYVTNAGPTGSNSDYIGIDSLAYITQFSSVNELNNHLEFNVYPNPTSGKVNMSIKAFSQERVINVVNMLGEVVYSTQQTGTMFEMDLSHLNKGIYFINIKDEKGVSTKKLVIE